MRRESLDSHLMQYVPCSEDHDARMQHLLGLPGLLCLMGVLYVSIFLPGA